MSLKTTQAHTQNFWKYAQNCGKCASLEDVFCEWAQEENITINEFSHVYAAVDKMVTDLFSNVKTAININMTPDEFNQYFKENGELPPEMPMDAAPTPDISAAPPIDQSGDIPAEEPAVDENPTDLIQESADAFSGAPQEGISDTSLPQENSGGNNDLLNILKR